MIVAIADNYAIGLKGKIPWHLSGDLKHFKELTTGHTVIMGRKTFESIGKVLPNRYNIIISSTINNHDSRLNRYALVMNNLSLALDLCKNKDKVFIIGGSGLYNEALFSASVLHVTRVHVTPEHADTFFPVFEDLDFKRTKVEEHSENGIKYEFETWEK